MTDVKADKGNHSRKLTIPVGLATININTSFTAERRGLGCASFVTRDQMYIWGYSKVVEFS